MTKSLTPAIEITQTGGAQLVTFTPSATVSQTPFMGNAVQHEGYLVEIFPNAPPQVSSIASVLPFLLTPFATKMTFAPLISITVRVQRSPNFELVDPTVIGESILLIPYGAKVIFASMRPRATVKTVYGFVDPNVVGP